MIFDGVRPKAQVSCPMGGYAPRMAPRATNARLGFWLATAAVLSAAGLTFWALSASVYASGHTILEPNPDASVRMAVALPLAVTSAVSLLLHVACRYDLRWARVAAGAVAWTLVAAAVVTGFSVGLYLMPIAIMLVAAARLTPVARA